MFKEGFLTSPAAIFGFMTAIALMVFGVVVENNRTAEIEKCKIIGYEGDMAIRRCE